MTTRRDLTTLAALLALAAPVAAQTPAAPLTPPTVLGAAKTIQFTATFVQGGHRQTFSVAYLELPNKAFVQDTNAKTKKIDIVYASDGKTQTEYSRPRSQYTKSGAPARITDADTRSLALSAVSDFLDPSAFAKFSYVVTAPVKRDGGSLAFYSKFTGEDDKGKAMMEQMYADPATGLPKEVVFTVDANGKNAPDHVFEETARIEFTEWKLNQPLNAALFHYTPPVTAALYTPPKLPTGGTQAMMAH